MFSIPDIQRVRTIEPLRSSLTMVMVMAATMAITGCATSNRAPVQASVLGKTKEQIVACAGTPLDERQDRGMAILTYYKEASILEEAFPQAKTSFPRVHHGCRARLGLKENRVVGVEYQSIPVSYQDDVHCEEIFEPCESDGQPSSP